MILADENIDFKIIKAFRKAGIDTYSVSENNSGITDEEVLELARTLKRVILTEDKDFGEWIFAHNAKDIGVVFLRYNFSEREIMIEILLKLLDVKKEELFSKYTIVTIKKIRFRNL